MEVIVLCRVAWCQKCYENNSPRSGQWFLLYGGERQSFFYYKNDYFIKGKLKGFSPHIFRAIEFIEGTAVLKVEKFCSRIGCDTSISGTDEYGVQEWNARSKYIEMTFKEFRALTHFVDTGYEL